MAGGERNTENQSALENIRQRVTAYFCPEKREYVNICIHDPVLAEEIGLCDEALYSSSKVFNEWATKHRLVI